MVDQDCKKNFYSSILRVKNHHVFLNSLHAFQCFFVICLVTISMLNLRFVLNMYESLTLKVMKSLAGTAFSQGAKADRRTSSRLKRLSIFILKLKSESDLQKDKVRSKLRKFFRK